MRTLLFCLFLVTSLIGLPAMGALAPVNVTYSVEGLAQLAPVATGSGQGDVNPGGGGAHLTHLGLPGGLASVMTTSIPTAPPTLFPFTQLIVTVFDRAGTFTENTAGLLQGPLALGGNVRICLGFACLLRVDIPLTENGTRGVGLGGPPIVRDVLTAMISLQGALWSTGTLTKGTSLGGISSVMGFAQGSASLTSSTATGNGTLQVVTPITVTASQGGAPTVLEIFGVMNVQLMPEPGTGIMLFAGAIAVAMLGRARRG